MPATSPDNPCKRCENLNEQRLAQLKEAARHEPPPVYFGQANDLQHDAPTGGPLFESERLTAVDQVILLLVGLVVIAVGLVIAGVV